MLEEVAGYMELSMTLATGPGEQETGATVSAAAAPQQQTAADSSNPPESVDGYDDVQTGPMSIINPAYRLHCPPEQFSVYSNPSYTVS